MTPEQWDKNFRELHGRYPAFNMPEPATVRDIYYRDLQNIPEEIFQKSIQRILAASPYTFPTAPVIRAACEAVEEELRQRRPTGKRPFPPNDHGCHLQGEIQISGARARLYAFSVYEAIHVTCEGVIVPRCPRCGQNVAPFENPFIRYLMDENPDDTECWNPMHKGTVLCPQCEPKRGATQRSFP